MAVPSKVTSRVRRYISFGFEISAQAMVVLAFIFLGSWVGGKLEARLGWENAQAFGIITGVILGLLESFLWFLNRLKKL